MKHKKRGFLLLLFIITFSISANSIFAGFEVDQILLRVLISDGSLVSRDLKITNTGTEATNIYINQKGLNNIAIINKSVLRINPGEYKLTSIIFSPSYRNVGNLPGVYTGSIVLSNGEIKNIMAVVEIESEDKIIDLNINFMQQLNDILQGEDLNVEVRIFNLKSINPVNAQIEYLIKDFDDNIILEEEEEVLVKGQTSFLRLFNLPSNIKTGNYVFAAKINYENSTGTSSYIFNINEEKKTKKILGICESKGGCAIYAMIAIALILLLLLIQIYIKAKSTEKKGGLYKFLHTAGLIKAKREKEKLKKIQENQRIKQKELEEKKRLIDEEFKKINEKLKYGAKERKNKELQKKLKEKLDLMEEAYKLGFISKESYIKDKKKIENRIRKLS